MGRHAALIAICGSALLAAAGMSAPADAIEIQCVAASKYKYLYQIFDNDPRKFADFLQIDPSRLPDGELCRAVVITGKVTASKESIKAGRTVDGDKLLQAIARNRGWLATLYLASPGGHIGMGVLLAQMTRLFWLKVRSPKGKTITYHPDFFRLKTSASGGDLVIPEQLAGGWRVYSGAVQSIVNVAVRTPCISACTFLHVAGIDRLGIAYVHRGRHRFRDKSGKLVDTPMSASLEGGRKLEAEVLGLYRSMDSGEKFIQQYQSTPTATERPAVTSRFPRYLFDALQAKCFPRGKRTKAEAADPAFVADIEQCVAAAHEKERLSQFAKFCGKGCDRRRILSIINARRMELLPAKTRPRKTPPQRPR